MSQGSPVPPWDDFVEAFATDKSPAALEAFVAAHPEFAAEIRRLWQRALALRAEMPDEEIGPYHLLRRIAGGGMGTVYLAEQRDPERRLVALKVVKLGMDSEMVLRRFRHEQHVLASMDHPNVASMLGAGVTAAGRPYFVMEYVDGLPIDAWCDGRQASVKARLRIFTGVCAGVAHAHRKRVIHRDLKPSNVLVTEREGCPAAKVIDFGLARALGGEAANLSTLTTHGQALGTPDFASPEQLRGESHLVDERADVYSLGMMLFLLLTGELPGPIGPDRTPQRVLATRLRHEFTRASSVVSRSADAPRHARARSTTAAELAGALRGALDVVLLKATAIDPEARYPTPEALAADLERVLASEPIGARAPTVRYRSRRWVARHPVLAAALGLAVVGLAAGFVADARIRRAEAESARNNRSAVVAHERFDHLSLALRLDQAKREAAELHPATAALEPRLRRWLEEQGEPLVGALPELEATASRLEQSLAGAAAGSLDTQSERREHEADRFLSTTLEKLTVELRAFRDRELESVRRRWLWARDGRQATVERYAERWREATAAAARDARYAGLRLEPQVGLVPLGSDQGSGLLEFVHLRSGAPDQAVPARDPTTGQLRVDAGSGIVLVLLPPGELRPGAQRTDPDAELYDPAARPNEHPPGTVRVAAFFLGKHEITQAQWLRLGEGDNPSYHAAGARAGAATIVWTNPVEQVSAVEGRQVLARHCLRLPREIEWEYACRAGTRTPWSCGSSTAELARHANLSDRAAHAFAQWPRYEAWDDGHAVHAPVGSFLPNGFGLHDLHGNVFEWCEHPELAPVRGGSFMSTADLARASYRGCYPVALRFQDLGLRAARSLGAE